MSVDMSESDTTPASAILGPVALDEKRMKDMKARLISCQDKVAALSQEYFNLKGQLAEASAKFVSQHAQHGGNDISLEGTVKDLIVNVSCQLYLHYQSGLRNLIKITEKLVKSSERIARAGVVQNTVAELSQSVESMNQCMSYVTAMEQLAIRVHEHEIEISPLGENTVAKLTSVSTALHRLICEETQKCLGVCHWPPPLMPSSRDGDGSAGWNGFVEAGEDVFASLQQLLVILISMQMGLEHEKFSNLKDSSFDPPILWAGDELARGINEWLLSHFGHDLPTSRVDKPEWLFATILQAVRRCGAYADLFNPCIEAYNLQAYYIMKRELALGVYHGGLATVLRNHYFPTILAQGDGAFWLHYFDEATKFELLFFSCRSDSLQAQVETESAEVSHHASSVELLFENPEWQSAWLEAESCDVQDRISDLAKDQSQWHPRQILLQEGSEVATEAYSSALASLNEFFPPQIVVSAIDILVELFKRIRFIHDRKNKLEWCRSVIRPALESIKSHFLSELTRAEQFDHLIDSVGLPKLSGSLNGLHYLEHFLREPSGILLDLLAQSQGGLDAFLDKEATSCSTMRRLWTNKLVQKTMGYIFSSFGNTDILPGQGKDNDHGREMDEEPSPAVTELRLQISALLQTFSSHFDAVIFRETWKGMAMSSNDAFVEEILNAWEISPKHARRMKANLSMLMGAYASFTKKPASYFKESEEAMLLLEMDPENAHQLMKQSQGTAFEALQAPRQLHVLPTDNMLKHLSPESARKILLKRTDLPSTNLS